MAVLNAHPVQYQAPLFKKISENPEIDLMVYFCWDFGVKEASFDAQFGKKIKWDISVLEGYKYKFLKNYSLKPSSDFLGQINFGIIKEIYNLKKQNYNAVVVFGWNAFTNWLAFLTAFILGLPIFLRGESPLNQELLKPKWKIKIKKIILGTLFKFISVFLYIGEENKKFYRFYGVPEEKLFFTPYAVDNSRFIKAARDLKYKKKYLRKELGIDEKSVVILFVGKLIEKKRPMDLLKAYELLSKNQNLKTKTCLLFVGDGALWPELENYAKENNLQDVHFVGFKNQTELPQYYAMADIFVLPSGVGETWGLVINEAMCFGLAIIVSDRIGCAKDLARNGENGYIFPFSDAGKLSEYLGNLIEDNKKIKRFGEKSFEIIQNYSHQGDVGGTLTALNSLE